MVVFKVMLKYPKTERVVMEWSVVARDHSMRGRRDMIGFSERHTFKGKFFHLLQLHNSIQLLLKCRDLSSIRLHNTIWNEM